MDEPIASTDSEFTFGALPSAIAEPEFEAAGLPADPLGPLAGLVGTWEGKGFNTIWRPHDITHGGQDRFLELNETKEKLAFTKINGPIPNRGLLMGDINMFGLTYMQQIAEASNGTGLHIEPGIWANVPHTTNPSEPPTVVRMASIPHGTTILAQGVGKTIPGGPHIADNNILPFPVGSPAPPNSQFPVIEAVFTELNLSVPTSFRFKSPGVTQAMVENPNSVIQDDPNVKNGRIKQTTVLVISTRPTPVKGGGTSNTAFLEAATFPPGGNAKAVEVDAIFWIEEIDGGGFQLQYTQLVQLDFNGLRWPHVTVATLKKV